MTRPGHRDAKPGEEHDGAPAQASSANPTASTSLLTALLANPLDADYEHYQTDRGSWPAGLVSRIAVSTVAVALGFGSAIVIGSLRRPVNDAKAGLKEQAVTRSSNVEALSDEPQSLGRAVGDLSQSGSPIPVDGTRNLVTTTRPVDGPGTTVTLTDRSGPGKGSGTVRGQDVAMVVNVLWAAGVGAILVNDQRIGPDTFVRTAEAAILVNMTPVSSPYEVTAIGDSNALSVALAWGATGDYLSAARSISGMTASPEISQSLSMEALAPNSSWYTQSLDTQPEGDTQ